ncbi:MAG: hypothetical protein E7312_00850 [Clostridiales bacterium]|nr:hypothetical protein [Clostridiales bacterium]
MAYQRNDSFVLGFWNYNSYSACTENDVKMWKDLGLNVAMAPLFCSTKQVEENLPQFLDLLQKYGLKTVLFFEEVDAGYYARNGEEVFRAKFREIYEKYGKHPAVLGFYPGEEPGSSVINNFASVLRIMLEEAPDKVPFVDLGANDSHMEQVASTGVPVSGFGNYSQMEPEERGTEDYFKLMCAQMKACKKYGMDCMPTLLSSAHYRFQAPKEVDYIWQINTAAICGCTGIYWFRLYDKLTADDYRGSPIDEYGEPNGEYYRGMKRAQTRFNIHHGKLIMKLHHDTTYFITKRYGGYPAYPEAGHGLVKRAYSCDTFFGYYDKDPIPGIVSFFKGEDGFDYVAVMNNSRTDAGSITLEFDKAVKSVEHIYYNGDSAGKIRLDKIDGSENLQSEIWLAPAQMEIYRIK